MACGHTYIKLGVGSEEEVVPNPYNTTNFTEHLILKDIKIYKNSIALFPQFLISHIDRLYLMIPTNNFKRALIYTVVRS